MEKQFLKDLTDAGIVKVNFEKKDLQLRKMTCTTNVEFLKENAEKTKWKGVTEDKSAPTILPVWDVDAEGWRNIPIAKVVFVMANSKIAYTRFIQIVRELDDSHFIKHGKKTISYSKLSDYHQVLHKNLWGMFNTRFTGEDLKAMCEKAGPDFNEPFGCNVSDYAWTKEVEDEFYDHPENKPIVKALKKSGGMTWGMWALDCEPTNIDHFGDAPIIEEGFDS